MVKYSQKLKDFISAFSYVGALMFQINFEDKYLSYWPFKKKILNKD